MGVKRTWIGRCKMSGNGLEADVRIVADGLLNLALRPDAGSRSLTREEGIPVCAPGQL